MHECYQLRSLTDDDISSWSEFCADCFSYKSNPPPSSYFQRHFQRDPRRDSSLIHVISYRPPLDHKNDKDDNKGTTCSRESMVSSVRIFQRTISLGPGTPTHTQSSLEAGGIGEVCTSEQHRNRGLAKRLLLHAIDTMSSDQRNMQCSLLHASPALTAVYERSGGYVCVNSKWSVVTIDVRGLNTIQNYHSDQNKMNVQVRLASFPGDTKSFQRIHKKYSEERFAGCIIRSVEYWNEYLKHEIGDSLYVLTVKNKNNNGKDDGYYYCDDSGSILGWISIRPRNGFQLRDFGVDLDQAAILGYTTAQILSALLKVALEKEGICISHDKTQLVELQLPTVIVDEMKDQKDFCEEQCSWVNWSCGIRDDDDIGWMYKMLQQNGDIDSRNNIIEVVNTFKVPHLIWPSDSF